MELPSTATEQQWTRLRRYTALVDTDVIHHLCMIDCIVQYKTRRPGVSRAVSYLIFSVIPERIFRLTSMPDPPAARMRSVAKASIALSC